MDDRYLLNYPKSISVAYALLLLFGVLGVHRFYTKRIGTGILYLFTIGLFGIGVLVDCFTLASKTDELNRKLSK